MGDVKGTPAPTVLMPVRYRAEVPVATAEILVECAECYVCVLERSLAKHMRAHDKEGRASDRMVTGG